MAGTVTKEKICSNVKCAYRNVEECFLKRNANNDKASSEETLHKTFLECWNIANFIEYFMQLEL